MKSLRGIDVASAEVEPRGLQWDRRWMVVDNDGHFLTQRNLPIMAQISTAISDGNLTLTKGRCSVDVPLDTVGRELTVTVWKSEVLAEDCGNPAAEWLSGALETPCRLVRMPDSSIRLTGDGTGDQVSFADGYPLLLANSGSLDDLNRRFDKPFPMNRFRPNLVVDGDAWAEDAWSGITIGRTSLRSIRPCGRCQVIATDQVSGNRGVEPLQELARFRLVGQSVNFGINLVPDSLGVLSVGDRVEATA